MKLSLITVSYFSAAELPACVQSFRREAAALGADAEVVVVDHSEDAAAAAAAAAIGADRVIERPNRGYAAGLNAGVAAARGDILILVNPDVELLPGCLETLVRATESGGSVVGPTLVWDRAGRLLLPVPEDPRPTAAVWRAARTRSQKLWALGLHADLERSWQLWRAAASTALPTLRGPVLVLGRDTWERLGPLDEGYFLYYEETEWLWRAHRRGVRIDLVGSARAVHRWGHAAGRLPGRDEVEERSRRRFAVRNYPWPVPSVLAWLGPPRSAVGVAARRIGGPDELPEVEADLWLLSPFAHLLPAAGWLEPGGRPRELSALTSSGQWYAAAAGRQGERWQILGGWCWGGA